MTVSKPKSWLTHLSRLLADTVISCKTSKIGSSTFRLNQCTSLQNRWSRRFLRKCHLVTATKAYRNVGTFERKRHETSLNFASTEFVWFSSHLNSPFTKQDPSNFIFVKQWDVVWLRSAMFKSLCLRFE